MCDKVLYFVFFTSAVAAGFSLGKVTISDDINARVVGSADGKVFFAVNSPEKNWTEAGKLCRCMEMQLAEITSVAQANTIAANYDPYQFSGWYWTGGRDSQKHTQFSWNSSNEEVSSSVINTLAVKARIHTCLDVFIASTLVWLVPEECYEENKVLCEITAEEYSKMLTEESPRIKQNLC